MLSFYTIVIQYYALLLHILFMYEFKQNYVLVDQFSKLLKYFFLQKKIYFYIYFKKVFV